MTQAQENIEQPAAETPPVELEIVEQPEAEGDDLPEAAPAPPHKPFDPKTDKVEFTTPEQQEKFNYVYKQIKMSDARNAMLTDMLQEQQKQLDDVKSRFSQTDSAEAERILMTKIKAARDAGDDMAEINATKEMVEFLADKKVNSLKAPQQQQPQMPAQDINYVSSLMQERDFSGNLVRPWLNEGHPDFESALSTLENIALKYKGDPQSLSKSLAELDQAMRTKMTQSKPPTPAQSRAPSPMQGGNLTNAPQKTTIKMTRQELDIAKKLGVDPKRYAAKRDELAKRK